MGSRVAEQLLLRCGVLRIERLLIAPGFEHDEMAWPSDLLEELDAEEAVARPVGITITAKGVDGGLGRSRPHFDVRDGVERRVG